MASADEVCINSGDIILISFSSHAIIIGVGADRSIRYCVSLNSTFHFPPRHNG